MVCECSSEICYTLHRHLREPFLQTAVIQLIGSATNVTPPPDRPRNSREQPACATGWGRTKTKILEMEAVSTDALLCAFAAPGTLRGAKGITMRIVSDLQYMNREIPMPGDRITNREGRLGTVLEVRTGNRAIFDGELAVRWDDGVLSCNYPLADNFVLISRAPQKE